MEITGEFETHITIESTEPERFEALKKWGELHGLKFLHIILERGFSVSQPMLTRKGYGDFSDEYVKAANLSKSLDAQGFSVSRIKIEIASTNRSVPQSNSELLNGDTGRYFENHIKLLLENSVNIELLAKLVEPYSAHLSHSASRFRNDNRHERFITQRCQTGGLATARFHLENLMSAVLQMKHQILKVEEEYVVYDSNLALDLGWINSEV